MQKLNRENSEYLKASKKIIQKLTKDATFYANDDDLKNEPETRIMSGIRLGLETKIYNTLRECQKIQIDVKNESKEKVKKLIDVTGQNVNDDDIDEYINDPTKSKALFTQQMASNVHVNVKNKIADLEEKKKEMEYIQRTVAEITEMVESLATIVRSNTNLVNSIEHNLKGARDYIKKAVGSLEKAKVAYEKGNKYLWCIFASSVVITC